MYLLDTNIFLELLLGQEKTASVIRLLERAVKGEIATYITRFSLYSVEIILVRNDKLEELRKFLEILGHAKEIKILNTNTYDDQKVLDVMEKWNLDFDDAIQYYLCKSFKLELISFDKHFDKTDIKRIEPSGVI